MDERSVWMRGRKRGGERSRTECRKKGKDAEEKIS